MRNAVKKEYALSNIPVDEENLKKFASELADLCRRYGYGIAEAPSIFIMEGDDYKLNLAVDGHGRLVFT